MNRRSLIFQGVGFLCVGLSGCLGSSNPAEPDGGGNETTLTKEGKGGENATTDRSEGSTGIKIESSIEKALSIELTVTREGITKQTETIDVPPSQSVFADCDITEPGIYEVIIKTDSGREGSTRVSVDNYALNHGRNIVIAITPQMIQGYIQE